MIDRRPFTPRRRPSPHSGRRVPRAWQDPALWAWVAVAVFALLPLTHVIASPASMASPDARAARADQASAGGGGTP